MLPRIFMPRTEKRGGSENLGRGRASRLVAAAGRAHGTELGEAPSRGVAPRRGIGAPRAPLPLPIEPTGVNHEDGQYSQERQACARL